MRRASCRLSVPAALRRSALLVALVLATAGAGCSSLPRSAPRTAEDAEARRFRELALASSRQGDHERAEFLFLQALRRHAAVDRRAGVVECLVDLGHVRLAMDDLDAAASRFDAALEACGDLVRPDLEARACGGLGVVALRRDAPPAARQWLERALALIGTDPTRERAVLLHDLGQAAWASGDTTAAARLFTEALAMHEARNDRAGIATTCYSLAGLRADAGDLESARALAQRALLLDRSLGNGPGVAQALGLLARVSVQAGDDEQADHYFRRAALAWRALDRPDAAAAMERSRRRAQHP